MKKQDQKSIPNKPTVKKLIDDLVSPESINRFNEKQIRVRGKVSISNPTDQPNCREFIIETDSADIPRITVLNQATSTAQDISAGILKFQRIIQVKSTKLLYQVFCKIMGNANTTEKLAGQRKFAAKILSLDLGWKRRQHLFRSFKHLVIEAKAKAKLVKYVPNLARIFSRLERKRVRQAFQQIFKAKILQKSMISAMQSQANSQLSLPLDPNDPRKLKLPNASRFIRKNSSQQSLTDRPKQAQGPQAKQYDDLKRMSLSNQCKEALTKMQRFDRYIYAQQSEKQLRVPVETELRRLEKIKNMDKSLRSLHFDNELTINVLFNHIKTICEMNKQINQRDLLREKVKEMEEKIIQTNVQKQKEVKQLIDRLRKPQGDENSRLKGLEVEMRQNKKLNQILFQSSKQSNEKMKRVLEVQIKKHQSQTNKQLSLDRKQILEFIQTLLVQSKDKPEAKTQTPAQINFNELKIDLKNLFTEQTALERSLAHLEKQKKQYEFKEGQGKTSESKQLYSVLSAGSSYISALYTQLKSKNQEISELNKKIQQVDRQRQRVDRLRSESEQKGLSSMNRVKADLENQRSRSKDLERKLIEVNKSIKTEKQKESKEKQDPSEGVIRDWQTLLATLLGKVESQEKGWQNEVQRQRKMLNTKRITDKFTNLISLNVSLLQLIAKKQKAIEQLNTQITQIKNVPSAETKRQEAEEKYNRQKEKVRELTDQRAILKKQIQELSRADQPGRKEALTNQVVEIAKIFANMEQLIVRIPQPDQNLGPVEWFKVKRLLDRKRFTNLSSVVQFVELLLRMLSQSDEVEKKKQAELNKSQNIKTREINAMSNLNKAIDKIIDEKNFKFQQNTIARLRKVLQMNLIKYDKVTEGPFIGWYGIHKDSTFTKLRLLAIAEEEKYSLLHEIQQLQSYISQLQTQLKNEKQSSTKLQTQTSETINKLQAEVIAIQKKAMQAQDLLKKAFEDLQEEKNGLIGKIDKRDQQIKRLEEKIRNLENRFTQQTKQIKQYKQSIEGYCKEEKAMLSTIELLENTNKGLQTQLDILHSGASAEDQARVKAEQQRGLLVQAQQKVKQLTLQLEKKEQENKRLEASHKSKIQELEKDLRNVQGNLSRLLQVNSVLQVEKQQLERKLGRSQSRRQSASIEHEMQIAENPALQSQLLKVQQRISVLQQTYLEMQQQNARLKESLAKKEEQHLVANDKIRKLQKDIDFAKSENQALMTNIDQQDNQIRRLRELLAEADRATRDHLSSSRYAQEDANQQVITGMKNKIIALEKQLALVLSKPPDVDLIEQIKQIRAQYDKREEEYIKIIKEMRSNMSKDNPNTTIAMNQVIKLAEQVQQENRQIKQLKADTEENYKKIIDNLTNQLHATQIQLVQMKSQSMDIRLIDQLREQFSKKEQQYVNTIKQIKKNWSESPTKNFSSELITLTGQVEKANKQIHRLKAELKSAEDLYQHLQQQNQAALLRRQQTHEAQINLLRRELDQISKSQTQSLKRIEQEYRSRESELQKRNQETLSSWFSKERELQTEISRYRAQAARLTIPEQQDHFNLLLEEIASYQGRIRQLQADLSRTKGQLVRSGQQFREKEDQYLKIISDKDFSLTHESRISKSSDVVLLQTPGSMRQRKQTAAAVQSLEAELKRQQEHYIKLMEQQTTIFSSKQKSFQTQILNLQQQITKLTKQTVQQSIVQNLELELRRQEDHYLKLIEQHTIILHSKEKCFQTEINQLKAELNKSRSALASFEELHEKSLQQAYAIAQSKQSHLQTELSRLRGQLLKTDGDSTKLPGQSMQNQLIRQKEYYCNLIDENRQNHDLIESQLQQELVRLRTEMARLKRQQSNVSAVAALQAQLTRQEQHYTSLLEQGAARLQFKEKSFQSQLELLRGQLKNLQTSLTVQQNKYLTMIQKASQTSLAREKSLEKELKTLKSSQQNSNISIQAETESKLNEQKVYYLALLDDNVQTFKREQGKLQAEIKVHIENNKKLNTDLEAKAKEVVQMKKQIDSKISEIERLKNTLSQQQLKLSNQSMEQKKLQQWKISSKKELEVEIANREQYFSKILEENAAIFISKEQEFMNQINALKDDLSRNSKIASSQINIEAQLKVKDQRIRGLQQELRRIDIEFKKKDADFGKITQQLKKFEGQVREKDEIVKKLTEINQVTTADFENKLRSAEANINHREEQLQKIKEQLSKSLKESQESKSNLRNMQQSRRQMDSLRNELKQKQQTLNNLKENKQIQIFYIRRELQQYRQKYQKGKNYENLFQQKDQEFNQKVSQYEHLLISKQNILRTQKTHFQKQRTDMQNHISAISSESSNYRSQNMIIKGELAKLKGQNSSLKNEASVLKSEITNLKDNITKIVKDMIPIAHFQNEMRMQQQHLGAIIDRNASIYMQQEARYQAQIKSLRSQSPKKEVHQMQLQAALEKHSSVQKAYRDEIQALKSNINNCQYDLNRQRAQVTRLKGIIDTEVRKSGLVQGELQQLRVEGQSLRENNSKLEQELRWERQQGKKMKDQIENQVKKSGIMQGEIQQIKSQNDQLRNQLGSLQTQANKLRSTISAIQNEKKKSLLNETQQLRNIIANLERELAHSRSQLQMQEANISGQNRDFQSIKGQSEQLKNQLRSIQNQLGKERNQTKMLRSNISSMEIQIKRKQTIEDQTGRQIKNLQNQLKTQRFGTQKLKQLSQNLETRLKSFSSMQGQSQQLKEMIPKLQGELRIEREQGQRLKKTVQSLQNDLKKPSEQVVTLKNTINTLQQDLSNLNTQHQRYKASIISFQNETKKNSNISQQTQQLKAQNTNLENQIKVLKEQTQKLKTQFGVLQLDNTNLKQQIQKTRNYLQNELKNQQNYYVGLIDQNVNLYTTKEKQFQQEIARLKNKQQQPDSKQILVLQEKLSRQQQTYEKHSKTMIELKQKFDNELNRLKNELENVLKDRDCKVQQLLTLKNKETADLQMQRKEFLDRQQKLQSNAKAHLQQQLRNMQQFYLKQSEELNSTLKHKQQSLHSQIRRLEDQLNNLRKSPPITENQSSYLKSIVDLKGQVEKRETLFQHRLNQQIHKELEKQESYFQRIIEEKVHAFAIKETNFETQINKLRDEMQKTKRMNTNQIQDKYLKSIAELKNQIAGLQIQFKGVDQRVNKQLSLQQQHFRSVLEQKETQYRTKVQQSEIQLTRLKNAEKNQNEFKIKQTELLNTIHNLKETIKKLENQQSPAQVVQIQYLQKTIQQNIEIFKAKESNFDVQISQMTAQLNRLRGQNVQFYLKNIIDLKQQIQQKDRSIHELTLKLGLSGSESIDQVKQRQKLLREQIVMLKDEVGKLTSKLSVQFVQQKSSATLQQLLKQKNKDYEILMDEFQKRAKLQSSHLDQIKWLGEEKDKLLRTMGELEVKVIEERNQTFKQRDIIKSLERERNILEEQLKNKQRINEVSQIKIASDQRQLYLTEIDRLRLRNDEQILLRKDFEKKYNEALKQKTGLLERIDKLQNLLHQKQLQMMKSFQQRQQNIQQLLSQNKFLQAQLKIIQQKLLAQDFKPILSPHSETIPFGNISQIHILRQENSFIKGRVQFLEQQLKQRENYSLKSIDKHMKLEGYRLKKYILDIQKSNYEIFSRLNTLTRFIQVQRDDIREISLLKKINEQVGELVESNKLLVTQVRALQNQNYSLHQTLISTSPETIEMALQITHTLQGLADLLSDHEIPQEVAILYDQNMERLEQCIDKKNVLKFMEIFEQFVKDLFASMLDTKDVILQRQAASLLDLRKKMGQIIDQQIQQSEYDERAPRSSGQDERKQDVESIKQLYRMYLKYRRPETLFEMGKILNIEE